MDARHFDALTRVLAGGDSRRRVLALLAAIPLLGGLFAILSPDEATAKDRRRRRKQRHKKRKQPGKRKRKQTKKCKPESVALTCAGKCGSVTNTCKKAVDCGSCDCTPACAECFTCQGAAGSPGRCVTQAAGTPCGDAATCEGGALQPQGSCDGSGTCVPASPVSCAPYTQCAGNACASSCAADGDCVAGDICCAGSCVTGICCGDADCDDPGAPDCVEHACVCASQGDTPCASGETCCDAGCVNLQTDDAHCGSCGNACGAGLTCQGGVCGVACGSDFCPAASEICVDDACQTCDVTCTGSAAECGAALQAAFEGSATTLYVCPGEYEGGFSITRTVTVIGAGEGEEPASNTVLTGNDTQRVLNITSGQVALRQLHVRDGNAGTDAGGGIRHGATSLTMHDCTVTSNNARSGGGIAHSSGTLAMTRCTVSFNTAPQGGGAATGGGLRIFSFQSATLTDCQITGNTTDGAGGGIFYLGGSLLTLAGNTVIQGNVADAGGGIFNSGNDAITIGEDCRITGNTAEPGEGGGIKRANIGQVTLEGTADPSPIVTNNCHENCAGGSIAKCATTPVFCPE